MDWPQAAGLVRSQSRFTRGTCPLSDAHEVFSDSNCFPLPQLCLYKLTLTPVVE